MNNSDTAEQEPQQETVLVTGASGFLGRYIVKQLIEQGYRVHTLNRTPSANLRLLGAITFTGDVSRYDDVLSAMRGCKGVFHVAAKAGIWGSYDQYASTNITGTRNVIKACAELKITRLIYTSTPSVTFGRKELAGATEAVPYVSRYLNAYQKTKTLAEQMVLSANHASLQTVALRPHLIWGPGDNHLIPRMVERARRKRLLLIGDGSNLIDAVYVENAAQAHIQAYEQLARSPAIGGKAYFITNQEPRTSREIINNILAVYGLKPLTHRIPFALAYLIGMVSEIIHRWLLPHKEPQMTRFLARQLATSHYFDPAAARLELNFRPKWSMQEGYSRLKEYGNAWIIP